MSAFLLERRVGFFNVEQNYLPEDLKFLPFANGITNLRKHFLLSQLFKYPECLSWQSAILRSAARKSSTLSTEPFGAKPDAI